MAGLTSNGFERKKLSDIKLSIESKLQSAFGPINIQPDSVFGQIIGILSEAISEVWEAAENVYNSQYPESAEGFSLDNVADLVGITRLSETKSSSVIIMEGTEGTVIPSETIFKQEITSFLFETDVPVTISRLNSLKEVISVNTIPSVGDITYTITLKKGSGAAVPFSTIKSIGDAENDILEALKILIDADSNYTASHDTVSETLTIIVSDLETSCEITVTSELTIDEIWTPATVSALEEGDKDVPINSITIIETPVSGLNQVDNITQGTPGRDTETDLELRIRRRQSLRISGSASVPAIEAILLQEVENVTSVTVIDNRTDFVDGDGRPPHSFEAIVTGGTDQDILDKLWSVKAAGIQTYGNTSGFVTDSQGDLQALYFSRPTPKYVHIELTITLNTEEEFPSTGVQGIKDAIVEYGESLKAGDDLIVQRFFTPIYTIPGILDITIYQHDVTTNPGDIPSYVTTNISIASNEIAMFDESRISVTVV